MIPANGDIPLPVAYITAGLYSWTIYKKQQSQKMYLSIHPY